MPPEIPIFGEFRRFFGILGDFPCPSAFCSGGKSEFPNSFMKWVDFFVESVSISHVSLTKMTSGYMIFL